MFVITILFTTLVGLFNTPVTVLVFISDPHVRQHSNQSDNNVHQVVIKPTTNLSETIGDLRVIRVTGVAHSEGHHKDSGKQLVQSLDGIQQTYEQTLHGMRTLGADELKDSSVDQHVGERRQDQRNNEQ